MPISTVSAIHCNRAKKNGLKNEEKQDFFHNFHYILQERLHWKKSADTNMKNQVGDFQETLNKKERQIDEINSYNRQLKDNITQLENQLR